MRRPRYGRPPRRRPQPDAHVILDGAVELTAEGDDGLDGNDQERIRGVDRSIRYLDKLVDELAKGKPMEKILRGEPDTARTGT